MITEGIQGEPGALVCQNPERVAEAHAVLNETIVELMRLRDHACAEDVVTPESLNEALGLSGIKGNKLFMGWLCRFIRSRQPSSPAVRGRKLLQSRRGS